VIADRLLGAVLPKAEADAKYCWFPTPSNHNYQCCNYPENGGITYCGKTGTV
jgi:hypothetical protein